MHRAACHLFGLLFLCLLAVHLLSDFVQESVVEALDQVRVLEISSQILGCLDAPLLALVLGQALIDGEHCGRSRAAR